MAELFEAKGYERVDYTSDYDLLIINTCAVTAESQRKSAQIIRRGLKSGSKVAVIGCYSQLDTALGGIKGVAFIGGSRDKAEVFNRVKELLDPDFTTPIIIDTDLSDYHFEPLAIGETPTDIFSATRAYIKIQDGCNGRCSYCIIPTTRGPSRSRCPDEIFDEASRLAGLGYKEVVLTGIEISDYEALPLTDLIRRIDNIEGIERLRFGSISPNTITREFVHVAATSAKFMPHFHISVQSASNKILNLMRRPYSRERLIQAMELIRDGFPRALVSADIIVGFPGETQEDFAETCDFVARYNLSHVHAFPFSARPGTPAADFEAKVPGDIIKERNRRLIEVSADSRDKILKSRVGGVERILVETIDKGVCTGHTEDYLETTCIDCEGVQVGDIIDVNIMSWEKGRLTAQLRRE